MSAGYVAVQWNRKKMIYDAIVLTCVVLYTMIFSAVANLGRAEGHTYSSWLVDIRAWGSCAFLMLTTILSIGPLARLDRRFLPLLYNRRHFGVIFFFVAAYHGLQVIDTYYAFGSASKWRALFEYDTAFTAQTVPFVLFGIAGLSVFGILAATSHDYWQKVLGPRTWKALHFGAYLGYLLIVMHVAFGAMQSEARPGWTTLVALSVLTVCGLHIAAARKSASIDRDVRLVRLAAGDAWIDAGPLERFAPDVVVGVAAAGSERIAVVRRGDRVHAVSGVCAHQGGPLAEGRVIDGCLTCPWHGWQYRPETGEAPPPFEEKLATYEVREQDGRIWVRAEPKRECGVRS
ncbi:MAG: Rieske 2Fe-2S domain-containing protein [Planctomycetota bacterium]